MERKQGKRNLAEPARRALSALELLIDEERRLFKPMEDGEFTSRDYIDALREHGIRISPGEAPKRLNKKVELGELLSRKSKVNGYSVNIYRENPDYVKQD